MSGPSARPTLPPGVNFTCMACRVGFALADAHREHFKSDWHRYNLKRKMASVPPVSAAEFRDRVMAQRNAAILAEAESEEGVFKCNPCGKKFNTENAYQNHLGSKKHTEAVKAAETRAQRAKARKESKKDYHTTPKPAADTVIVEESATVSEAPSAEPTTAQVHDPTKVTPSEPGVADVAGADIGGAPAATSAELSDDSDEWEVPEPDVEMTLNDCIFCGTCSESLEANLNHMSRTHGFFIPDVEHLEDLTGLIAYLQDKVCRYHICLTCNGKGKGFFSTEAVRGHMVSKGHCFVNYEEEGQLELEDFYDFGDEEDDGWEDLEGDEAEGAVATSASRELVAEEDAIKGDYELSLVRGAKPVVVEGYDLVLPSGARVGHRSLKRYYRQKFAVEDSRDSVVIQKLVSEYSAIGLPGFGPGSGAPTKEIRRERDTARRSFMYARMRQGMNHNKSTLNKHFREQNTQ